MANLLDTNIILRYLLNDDEKQSQYAKECIDNNASTINEVIPEVLYVLRKVYLIDRKKAAMILIDFLSEIYIKDKKIIIKALELYSENSLDFIDNILISRHIINKDNIITFDNKLKKKLSLNDNNWHF